jgi:thymidylate synthase
MSSGGPTSVRARSIGGAWLSVAGRILTDGSAARWGSQPTRELLRVTIEVDHPVPEDPIIARFADPERLAWMHANFTERSPVAELGDADSYAIRLYDYARMGRDQVAWVIERLRADPGARDATITTFQPLTDSSYVPCVSLLDFWVEDARLQLAVYAHSIDFGTKGYANLVELAALQKRVAADCGTTVGRLTMTVKSAHLYDTELGLMAGILAQSPSVPPE